MSEERDKKEAFVTLATNDTYSLGCLVLGNSLRRVGTRKQLAVMVTTGVSNPMRTQLAQVFDLIQEVNLLDSEDPVNLALLGRPDLNVTFTKLHCWRLAQYNKGVFLDADTLVLQNVDELFDREEISAAPDAGWPDCFNSGVFVFQPSQTTYESLLNFATSQGSFDGGDQGLLNMYFKDWSTKDIAKHLPFIYNVVSQAFYSYLPAFTQFKDTVKIVHFIGAVKPWHHTYNTSTRMVTPLPGTGHSQEFLQVWWNIFMQLVQPTLDPSLRKKRRLLPTIVVSHPRSPRIYAYIPDSTFPVIKQSIQAPWCWTRSFWTDPFNTSQQCCKMAFTAFSQCWQRKPKAPSEKKEELTRSLIPPKEEEKHEKPEERREDTIHVMFPFKPPNVEEIFYDAENNKDSGGGNTDSEKDAHKIIEMPIISRKYTDLESHYTEEPLSHMDPEAPPAGVYDATRITEGWEKGRKAKEFEKKRFAHEDEAASLGKEESSHFAHKDEATSVGKEEPNHSSIKSDTNGSESPTERPASPVEGPKLTGVNSDEAGLVGDLASMTIHVEPTPQRELSDKERKLNWERGQIDYLGQDSFDNIQRKIENSMMSQTSSQDPNTSSPFTPTPPKPKDPVESKAEPKPTAAPATKSKSATTAAAPATKLSVTTKSATTATAPATKLSVTSKSATTAGPTSPVKLAMGGAATGDAAKATSGIKQPMPVLKPVLKSTATPTASKPAGASATAARPGTKAPSAFSTASKK